jgi:hypothetical protein
VEETVATKTNGKYVGEVKHFSWWNCDYPYPMIELSGTLIVPSNDSTLNYATICLEMVSTGNIACTYTNQDGFFSGLVPANEAFILTVYSWYNCDVPVFTANVGPFSADTDLGDITLNVPNLSLVEVIGTVVDCANNPLTNGWVEINVAGQIFHTYVSDGTYSISFYNCNNATALTVQATNISDLQQGDVTTYAVTAPVTAIPEVVACGNTVDEWVTITIDGTTSTELLFIENVTASEDSITVYAFSTTNNYYAQFKIYNIDSGAGTYPGDRLGNSAHSIFSNTLGTLIHQCGDNWQAAPCSFEEVIITAFSINTGEYIQGSYSGTVVFYSNNQVPVTHELEVTFNVRID